MADESETAKQQRLITTFTEITLSSREEARLYLETHRWDLLSACLTAFNGFSEKKNAPNPINKQLHRRFPSDESAGYYPAGSSLPQSSSPPNAARYPLQGRADNNNGGEHSGTRGGQDHQPKEAEDTDAIESDARRPSSVQYVLPEPHVRVTHYVTVWRNGFTINDGPLNPFEDRVGAHFHELIQGLDYPLKLDSNTSISAEIVNRQEEDFHESPKPFTPFQGVGRALGPSASVSAQPPASSGSLVIDPARPTTSIQIILLDGTRIVSQFNTHHTVGDIEDFIDEYRPGSYQYCELLRMGFPPSPLPNPSETIEDTGIANSVLIQKLIIW